MWGKNITLVYMQSYKLAYPHNLSFKFDHVYMIRGATRHMLPHLSGVGSPPPCNGNFLPGDNPYIDSCLNLSTTATLFRGTIHALPLV